MHISAGKLCYQYYPCALQAQKIEENMTFFHFSQTCPWNLDRPAVNEPIAMAEAIDSHLNGQSGPANGIHTWLPCILYI